MNDINDLHQYAGRGRPRVENPLSPADRAKAYRDRKRAGQLVKSDVVTVTENLEDLDKLPSYGMLESRIILLTAGNIGLEKKLQESQSAEEHRTMSLGSAHSEIRALTAQIVALQAQLDKLKAKAKSRK